VQAIILEFRAVGGTEKRLLRLLFEITTRTLHDCRVSACVPVSRVKIVILDYKVAFPSRVLNEQAETRV